VCAMREGGTVTPDSGIYLDHAATTPLRPEVLEAMLPYLREHFGNPNSLHRFGRASRHAIEDAREEVAALLNAESREIIFTSGGTEANALALAGALEAAPRGGAMVCSAVEHHAVGDTAARRGALRVPVDTAGRVDLEALHALLHEDTPLVSVMFANNETGVLQPVEEIAAACGERGIQFHADLVQAAGKVPLDVRELSLDLGAISAHKLGGPKGVGASFVRHGLRFTPQLLGGAQERGRRAGTENVAGIVGFGKACALARAEMRENHARLEALRAHLAAGLLAAVPDCWINGGDAPALPHILNMGFEGVEGEALLLALDVEGIAVATGAACTSGAAAPSHVLLAMGQSHAHAFGAIRFSFGASTNAAEIARVLHVLPAIVARLRTHA